MTEQEGPVSYVVPEKHVVTCGECKWLKQVPRMTNHQSNTPSYSCMLHEDNIFGKPLQYNFLYGGVVPGGWCPFPVTEI